MEANEKTCSPRFAARRLGLNIRTVYRWCDDAISGKPARHRDTGVLLMPNAERLPNGRFRVRVADVETLLRACGVLNEPAK